MITHTQGEWIVSDLSKRLVATKARSTTWHHGSGLITKHALPIVRCEGEGLTDEECEANAKLIAAAPAMLEALIAIADHWANQYDHPNKSGKLYAGAYGVGVTDGHRCAAVIAREAIAKANGLPEKKAVAGL